MAKKKVREVVLDILLSIEKNQAYSNLLLNKMIQKNELSNKDVGLLTEIVYGTIQRRDTLDYYLSPFINNKKKVEIWVIVLLRLSLYQMVYLDRIPERAVLFEAVEIAKKRGHKGIASMVNGVLRTIQRNGLPSTDEIKDPVEKLSIESSHPLWLVKRWVSFFGYEEAKKMCEVNLLPPVQSARVNITKITVDGAIERLAAEGIEASYGELSPNSIKINKGNIAHSSLFKEGFITIQDESSMLVATALGVDKEDRVLDSCAAPGGKTTHIAELLHNTGSVTSLDLHDHKVKLIDEQVKRLGLNNVTTKALDSRTVSEHFEKESFDKILVDAPCSGFGVIRRKPDIKYSKTENDIHQLKKVQQSILSAVAPLLKKGGTLVYSTCTIDEEENEQVINEFLNNHTEYIMDNELADKLPNQVGSYVSEGKVQLLPHYFGTDGFFIASFRKQV
ncbi:16S rRNA (cytosine(967)-C(5))-methyltransferase RsmB [Bacillus sp. PS06]|uniref:16S rRNA (cytosine(967)-C(5))-methyltransferase RsmB n=1 Tax=Bacillus sp. PS06 TaxID=2764176 RepID=UPI00177A7E32|nr:16S rRNA (cytosine(967)-C(5))-methyltransferase RsmB [Bacillus sp. PS06]MBD8068348.1 16S rRNA (cytosine(967)-C(5))-methyltransferase RsmB [Bacillus sp. PS06]